MCGCGIRDVAVILEVSVGKALKTLMESYYGIKPKKKRYTRLEVDELWTLHKIRDVAIYGASFHSSHLLVRVA